VSLLPFTKTINIEYAIEAGMAWVSLLLILIGFFLNQFNLWLGYIYNPAAGCSFLDAVFNLHGIAGEGAIQNE
jgi:hypothetical protein